MRTLTHVEWLTEAVRLFGSDPMTWRFVCPSCGHVASVQDWKQNGADEVHVAYSCVGRFLPSPARIFEKPGPCDYTGGGLFGLNPVHVIMDGGKSRDTFEFDGVIQNAG